MRLESPATIRVKNIFVIGTRGHRDQREVLSKATRACTLIPRPAAENGRTDCFTHTVLSDRDRRFRYSLHARMSLEAERAVTDITVHREVRLSSSYVIHSFRNAGCSTVGLLYNLISRLTRPPPASGCNEMYPTTGLSTPGPRWFVRPASVLVLLYHSA
jgi:hypothetical protein